MSDTKKPAAHVDLFPVSVSIWANKTDKGGVFYNVIIGSRYKDANGKWQNSVSLSENELLLGAKALDLAHTEVLKLRASGRQANREEKA